MNVSMRQGVQITTSKKRDAECISAALTQYGGSVEQDGRRWSVHLSRPASPELPDLLTALKACLDEHAIAAVKVAVDGHAYAMEGTASLEPSP
jgi:hypothetical protein